MSEVHDDQHPLDPTDHVAQLEGVLQRVSTSDRVVDLGAGLGRIGRPLAECGCEVVAVAPAEPPGAAMRNGRRAEVNRGDDCGPPPSFLGLMPRLVMRS